LIRLVKAHCHSESRHGWIGGPALTGLADAVTALVNTEAPPLVAGAKPALVERIRISGVSPDGNLDGNAPPAFVDQDSGNLRRYSGIAIDRESAAGLTATRGDPRRPAATRERYGAIARRGRRRG
jgi:hypothetical protein